MKKDIITNLKFLREKSIEVSYKEAKKLIKDLEDTLKECHSGIGLSAIQIGILKKVGIVRIDELKVNLINPELIDKQNKFRMRKEGCLSLPSLYIDTIRYNNITVINNGKEETYYGIIAVAIQHEIDHINGILITDRVWRKR